MLFFPLPISQFFDRCPPLKRLPVTNAKEVDFEDQKMCGGALWPVRMSCDQAKEAALPPS